MPGKYELKKAAGGQFMFNLKAGNHQVILTSERYKQRASAVNGIKSVQKNGTKSGSFDRRTAKNGKPYFVLKSPNGEIIGRSEMYNSTSSMENGIKSVMKNAGAAKIDEI